MAQERLKQAPIVQNERFRQAPLLSDAQQAQEERDLFARLQPRTVAAQQNNPVASARSAGLGQGLALSFGDELRGFDTGVQNVLRERNLGAFGPGFRAGRRFELERLAQQREERPGQVLAGELGGALGAGAGIGAGVGALNLGARATPALAGGITGGVIGAGQGDSARERAIGAGIGAPVGAISGVVGDELLGFVSRNSQRAIGSAFRRIAESPRMKVLSRAFRRLRSGAQADDVSEAQFNQQIRQFLDEGDPNDFLFEQFGANTREHTRAAASAARQQKTFAQQAIDARKLAQQNRLNAELAQTVSNLPVGQAKQAIKQRFQTEGSRLFQDAFGIEPTPQAVNRIATLRGRVPIIEKAFQKAARQLADFGEPNPSFWRLAHEAKEVLDDQIGTALKREGRAKFARGLVEQKNALRGILSEENPQYGQALKFWAGNAADDNAIDAGLNIFKLDEDDVVDLVRGYSDSERSHFLAGVAKAARRRFEAAGESQNAINRLRATSLRNKLRNALSDDEADAFFEVLAREESRVFNQNFIDPRGGSQTALRQEATEAFRQQRPGAGLASEIVENPLGALRLQRGRQQLAQFIRGGDVDEDLADAFIELALTRGSQGQSPLEELLAAQSRELFEIPSGIAAPGAAIAANQLLLQNR